VAYDREQYEEEKATGRRAPSGALRLKELSGKHLRCINLHLAGVKGYAIAQEMDMTEAWVSTVLNDPLAMGEIRQRFVDVDNEMYAKATAKIDDAMDSADIALALRASEMVWRARGRFDKKETIRTSAEDVVARMLELAEQNGNASVTISATAGPTGEASRGEASRAPTIDGEVSP
jgi:hypothetical protein